MRIRPGRAEAGREIILIRKLAFPRSAAREEIGPPRCGIILFQTGCVHPELGRRRTGYRG